MEISERQSALVALLGCPLETAQALDTKMSQLDFGHKEFVVHQGAENAHIWLVLGGNAQVQVIGFEGQVTLLTAHGPGELFGAFSNEAESRFDVKAYGQLNALRIGTVDLQQLLGSYPAIGNGLYKILGNQFNAVMDRLASHVTLTATGRVYQELLRMSGSASQISPPPVVAALALTAQTTRETASRAINALVRRGIIERDKSHLEIVSRGLLESLVV